MDVKLLRLIQVRILYQRWYTLMVSITTIKKPFVLIPMVQNPGSSSETKLYFSPFIFIR